MKFAKPVRLVILDVDGVILQIAGHFEKSLEETAQKMCWHIGPILDYFAKVREGSTDGGKTLTENVRYMYPERSDEERASFVYQTRRHQLAFPPGPIPGSKAAIRQLMAMHCQLAICTTRRHTSLYAHFERAKIDLALFRSICTWESAYQKPDPRALDLIFAEIPVDRDEAIFVGDWYPDHQCARDANVRFVAVESGYWERRIFAKNGVPEDHIIPRLSYLPKLITNKASP